MRSGKYTEDVVQALKQIQRGERIFIGTGAGAPGHLIKKMVENYHHFSNNEIVHLSTLGPVDYLEKRYRNSFRLNALFVSDNSREQVNSGLADYTPVFLSEIPELFNRGRLPLGAAFIQVAPGVKKGTLNLGVSVDVIRAAIANAKIVIAQLNRNMPATFGDSVISEKDVDFIIEHDEELVELHPNAEDQVVSDIAQFVEKLIPDGATLQFGIGRLPHAVAKRLNHKNDLGIHTELISDTVMELIRNGNVNGKKKSIDKGLAITSFAMGSRQLYRFLGEEKSIHFRETSYTNNVSVIGSHPRFVSVNSALEVDLTGQVAADSVGREIIGGIGGQVDFIRGAKISKEGMAIIALPATALNGSTSRIVPVLSPGSGVVTSRGDVQYVVTEFGIADLYGKSLEERALSLIEISHPDYREKLLDMAKEMGLVRGDFPLFSFDARTLPEGHKYLMVDKKFQLRIRPLKPSDEKRLQEFFYSHDEESIYQRYGLLKKHMHHEEAVRRVTSTDLNNIALTVMEIGMFGERIRGIARYSRIPETNIAEVGIIVDEKMQGKGIGRALLTALGDCARKSGIELFVYMVRTGNTKMLKLFRNVYPNGRVEKEEDYFKCMTPTDPEKKLDELD